MPPMESAQRPVSDGAEPTWQLPDAVRRSLLLLPPLLIAVLEEVTGHPVVRESVGVTAHERMPDE